MQMSLFQEEQKVMDNDRTIAQINEKLRQAREQGRDYSEQLDILQSKHNDLQLTHKEQSKKYNDVKKKIFGMKDQFKAEMSDVNKQMIESSDLKQTYEKLVVDHQ